MKLYSEKENYKLYQGSMLDMLDVIDKETIDCIITDPPYELNFMSKGWDNAGVSFSKDTWKKCFDVLKEGGYLLAFGGTRTYHRIACAIEDAGFEIRDCIMWLYGSGFPKSMDISKRIDKKAGAVRKIIGKKDYTMPSKIYDIANGSGERLEQNITAPETDLAKKWQGWGTCLKPAYEPIIIARKPFKGSLVDNVIQNGVGGLNIDECRVETTDKLSIHSTSKTTEENDMYKWSKERKTFAKPEQNLGRFPANVIHDGSDEVIKDMPSNKKSSSVSNHQQNNTVYGEYGDKKAFMAYSDDGSVARYFYCAKASKKDRDEGLEEFESKTVDDGCKKSIDNAFQRGETLRKNTHPTVKPTELMQYLVRLIAPKGAIILDPFNGSGSTGKAVMYENKERNANYEYIGIELTEEYLPIAAARIEYVINLKEQTKEFEQITI